MTDIRPFFVMLLASIGAVYTFNARYATTSPSLAQTATLAAEQTPSDVIASDNTLYQRGWTRARLMAAPGANQPCPDLVVLGSSAMGTFAPDMFPGLRVLNGWHGNFSVQDMESYAAVLGTAPCKPKDIVVGIDLFWSANNAWSFEGWQDLAFDYASYHAAHGGFSAHVPLQVRWDEYKENVGFGRTIDTLRSARERNFRTDALARGGLRLIRAQSLDEACRQADAREQYLRTWDGHYLRCPNSESSDASVVRVATDYLAANIHNMADWHELSRSRLDRVEQAIAAWHALGINVLMLGIPYNPITWQILTADPTTGPNIRELDERLLRMAQTTGTMFLSLRDATTVPCTTTEFEDSHHPRPACTRRVAAKAIFALEAAHAAAALSSP